MKLDFVSWFKKSSQEWGGQLLLDEPLSRHTYYRIGGPASIFAVPKSLADLQWLAQGIAATGCSFFILGQGSNLLVSDEGFCGLVIRIHRLNLEISSRQIYGGLMIRTGASVVCSSLLRRASHEGWSGLEFLTGIPGSMGGVVTMNAGTHLGEAQGRLRKVEVFHLQKGSPEKAVRLQSFEGEQLKFQYRKNLFVPRGSVIWAAEWQVEQKDPIQVKSVIDETLLRRKATQPIDFPSCGSVFKNPKGSGKSAWQVIDLLGLRGFRIGDAQFSEKHSNFIINLGSAQSTDVRKLIELAKTRAQQELGIFLEEEVIYLDKLTQ